MIFLAVASVRSGGYAPATSVLPFLTTGTCCTHSWHLQTFAKDALDSSFPIHLAGLNHLLFCCVWYAQVLNSTVDDPASAMTACISGSSQALPESWGPGGFSAWGPLELRAFCSSSLVSRAANLSVQPLMFLRLLLVVVLEYCPASRICAAEHTGSAPPGESLHLTLENELQGTHYEIRPISRSCWTSLSRRKPGGSLGSILSPASCPKTPRRSLTLLGSLLPWETLPTDLLHLRTCEGIWAVSSF